MQIACVEANIGIMRLSMLCPTLGCEFLSDTPFFGLRGVKGGKLRMREWVELFDEPHFLAIFKLTTSHKKSFPNENKCM